MKIALTSVFVNSPVEAFKFYTEKLGFVERMYQPERQLAIVASPEDRGGTGLLLEPNDNPIGKTYQTALYDAGIPCITLGVSDLQAEYEKLKARGVTFKQTPTKTDFGTEAVIDDTCGNFVQLFQPPSQA
jgi:predicted enzyme related to lactoylglutathione lyase